MKCESSATLFVCLWVQVVVELLQNGGRRSVIVHGADVEWKKVLAHSSSWFVLTKTLLRVL